MRVTDAVFHHIMVNADEIPIKLCMCHAPHYHRRCLFVNVVWQNFIQLSTHREDGLHTLLIVWAHGNTGLPSICVSNHHPVAVSVDSEFFVST